MKFRRTPMYSPYSSQINAIVCLDVENPEQQTCQIWVGHSFEIWNLIFGWTRYKTEHRGEKVCCSKCFIVSFISFFVYFDKQVHEKLEKKLSKRKKFKPWILLNQTRTEKQIRTAALRHRIFKALSNASYFWINTWSHYSHGDKLILQAGFRTYLQQVSKCKIMLYMAWHHI